MTFMFMTGRLKWLPRFHFRQRGNIETWIWGQPVILVENEVALTWLFTIIVRWYA